MNKEVKKIWLAALKSGEYKQGKGRLRRDRSGEQDTYCCLGVLCDLSISHHNAASCWVDSLSVRLKLRDINGGNNRSFKVNDNSIAFVGSLPHEVMEWAGLNTTDAEALSDINDTTLEDDDFAEVIESIETTL